PMIGHPVPANESIFLRFQINEQFLMLEPGKYEIRFRSVRLNINAQTVSLFNSNAVEVALR
ncbi:MAG TPA: hypothetical protein VFL13_02395, partial [Candidatus Baltobacteraceae bacterium]|nr:hypothetical protein [Candidatus Baltobacteraceae bacterium]